MNDQHSCRRVRLGLAVLSTVFAMSGLHVKEARAEAPPQGAVPFPVDRTTIVRREDGPVYFVDGPTVIPENAEVTVQLGVTIVGVNNASLDVRGGLKVHGTMDVWVTIRDVDFSPTQSPRRGLHLDMTDMYGCRFVHAQEEGFRGEFTIENSCLQRSCAFDFRIRGGFLKVMTVEFDVPCKITCAREKENPKPVEVEVRSSWMKAVTLTGPSHANFRHSEIQEGLECRDVSKVMVDGCDISIGLSFHQGVDCGYEDITLTKCNLFDESVLTLDRVCGPRAKRQRVKVDKCYFGLSAGGKGTTDAKEIAEFVSDETDEPERKVRAWIPNPAKRMHKLVRYMLRPRAPPLAR